MVYISNHKQRQHVNNDTFRFMKEPFNFFTTLVLMPVPDRKRREACALSVRLLS